MTNAAGSFAGQVWQQGSAWFVITRRDDDYILRHGEINAGGNDFIAASLDKG